MKKTIKSDLVRGNIDTIILKALYEGDRYGKDIIAEVEQKSSGQYVLKQATLYSCLKRLEEQGQIRSYMGAKAMGGIGGRRKYYTLTDIGREVFANHQSEWEYSRTVIDKLISDKEFDFSRLSEDEVYKTTTVVGEVETAISKNDIDIEVENIEAEEIIEEIFEEEQINKLKSDAYEENDEDFFVEEENLLYEIQKDNFEEDFPNEQATIETTESTTANEFEAIADEYLDAGALLDDIRLAIGIDASFSENATENNYEAKPIVEPKALQGVNQAVNSDYYNSFFSNDFSLSSQEATQPPQHPFDNLIDSEQNNDHLFEIVESEEDIKAKELAKKALFGEDEEPKFTGFMDYRPDPLGLEKVEETQVEELKNTSNDDNRAEQKDDNFLSYSTRVYNSSEGETDLERNYQAILSRLVANQTTTLEEVPHGELAEPAVIPPSQDILDTKRQLEYEFYGVSYPEKLIATQQDTLPTITNSTSLATVDNASVVVSRELDDDIIIRTYSHNVRTEKDENFYYYSNRLKLVHFMIMFGIMFAVIGIVFLLENFAIEAGRPSNWEGLNAFVYVIFIVLTAILPIVAFVNAFIEIDKQKRIQYSFRNALLFRFALVVLFLIITYLINVYFGMMPTMNNALDHFVTLLLPALMSLTFPISSIVFYALFKSGRYAV